MKKTNREKQKLRRADRRWQKEIDKRIEEGNIPIGYDSLRYSKAYAGNPRDLGKLLYSYSDSRTMVDLPKGQRFRKMFDPNKFFLITVAALLCLWFVVALIYQLCTTTNVGKTLLHMLPTLLIVAVGTAILLLSAFQSWGKFLRFSFKHNLARGNDAFSRMRLSKMKADLERADSRKPFENKIEVTPDYIVFKTWGKEYIFHREYVTAEVEKYNGQLLLKLNIAGSVENFPRPLPTEEYVPLKKALREQLTTVRNAPEKDHALVKKLVSEIPAFFMFLLILGAGVMVIVTHYLWVPGIPPFLGFFFIGASFLALCNILSFIPAVNAVGLPFVFSLIIMLIPPWAIVWFEQNVFHMGSIGAIILNCDIFTVGFTFFTLLGVYAFIFSISKLIDYIRFGNQK